MRTTASSANFNITLEEHLHPIGEFERLDVIVHNESCSRVASLRRLLPLTKQLLLSGASIFVGKLQSFCTLCIVIGAIVSITIPNRYVILSTWISQIYQDTERFADLNNTRDRRYAWVRSSLDVHPTFNASCSSRDIDHFQHVHNERLEEDGVLLLLDLAAGNSPGSIPSFLNIFIALDDQHVVHGRTHRARWFASTAIERHSERELSPTPTRSHVTTLRIVKVTLTVDDTLEVRLELDGNEHAILLVTSNINRLDVSMIVTGRDRIGLPWVLSRC